MSLFHREHRLIFLASPVDVASQSAVEFLLQQEPEQAGEKLHGLLKQIQPEEKNAFLNGIRECLDALKNEEREQVTANLHNMERRVQQLATSREFAELKEIVEARETPQAFFSIPPEKIPEKPEAKGEQEKAWFERTKEFTGWNNLEPETRSTVKGVGIGVAAALGVFLLIKLFQKAKSGVEKGIEKTKSGMGWLGRTLVFGAFLALAGAAGYFGYKAFEKHWQEKALAMAKKTKEQAEEVLRNSKEFTKEQLETAQKKLDQAEKLIKSHEAHLQEQREKQMQKEREEQRKKEADSKREIADSAKNEGKVEKVVKDVVYTRLARGILAFHSDADVEVEQLQDLLYLNRESSMADVFSGKINSPHASGEDVRKRERAKKFLIEFSTSLKRQSSKTDAEISKMELKPFLDESLPGYSAVAMLKKHVDESAGDLKKIMGMNLSSMANTDGGVRRELELLIEELYENDVPEGWDKISLLTEAINLGDTSLAGFLKEKEPEDAERKLIHGVLRKVALKIKESNTNEFMLPLFHDQLIGERESADQGDADYVQTILINRLPLHTAMRLYLYRRMILSGNPAGIFLMQAEVLKHIHEIESKDFITTHYHFHSAVQRATEMFTNSSGEELAREWTESKEERKKIMQAFQHAKEMTVSVLKTLVGSGFAAAFSGVLNAAGATGASIVNFPKTWIVGGLLGAEGTRLFYRWQALGPAGMKRALTDYRDERLRVTRAGKGARRLFLQPASPDVTQAAETYNKIYQKLENNKGGKLYKALDECSRSPKSKARWAKLAKLAEASGEPKVASLANEFVNNSGMRKAFETRNWIQRKMPGFRHVGGAYSKIISPIRRLLGRVIIDERSGVWSKQTPSQSANAQTAAPQKPATSPEVTAAEQASAMEKVRAARSLKEMEKAINGVKNPTLRTRLKGSFQRAGEGLAKSKFLRRTGNVLGVVYVLLSADLLMQSRSEIEAEKNPQRKKQLEEGHKALATTLVAEAAIFGSIPSAAFSGMGMAFLGPLLLALPVGYAGKVAHDVYKEIAEWERTAADWRKEPAPVTLAKIEETKAKFDEHGRHFGFGTPRVLGWFESQKKIDKRHRKVVEHNATLRGEMFDGYFQRTTQVAFPQWGNETDKAYIHRIEAIASDKMKYLHAVDGSYSTMNQLVLSKADAYGEMLQIRKEYEDTGTEAVLVYELSDGTKRQINLEDLNFQKDLQKTRELVQQYRSEYKPLQSLKDFEYLLLTREEPQVEIAKLVQYQIDRDFIHARNIMVMNVHAKNLSSKEGHELREWRQEALEEVKKLMLGDIEDGSITDELYGKYMWDIDSIFLASSREEMHEYMSKRSVEHEQENRERSEVVAKESARKRAHAKEKSDFAPTPKEQNLLKKSPEAFVISGDFSPAVMQHNTWTIRDYSYIAHSPQFFRENTKRDSRSIGGVKGTIVHPSSELPHRFVARGSSGKEKTFLVYSADQINEESAEDRILLEHILTTPTEHDDVRALARIVSLFSSEVTGGQSWRIFLLERIKGIYRAAPKKREFLQELLTMLRAETKKSRYLNKQSAVNIQSWFFDNDRKFGLN